MASDDLTAAATIMAHTRWAKTIDRTAATEPARNGRMAKLEATVDPEGVLSPGMRRQRAEQLYRAQMMKASRKAAKVRTERAAVRRTRKQAG